MSPLNSSQTCWDADWGIALLSHDFCVYYRAAPIHHSHWLAAALRPVDQQVWPVGHAWWSMAWGVEQERGKRRERKMKKEAEDWKTERKWIGDHDNLLCRRREEKKEEKMGGIIGLVMIHGRSWMHFTDAIPGILVCVWMCARRVGVRGKQKKAQIKVQRQNIWLPGNRASSNGSIELWRMVVHDSTSPIRFQDGVGAGRRGGGDKDREMSPPVLICQGQWTMTLSATDFVSRGPTLAYQQGPTD